MLRALVFGTLGLAGALAALYFFWPAAFFGLITSVIVVDDPPEPVDLIFVLNGAYRLRAEKAAELHRRGFAPVVRLAHTREMARRPDRPLSELIAGVIVDRGVPEEAVATVPYPGGVVDTRDEARALSRWVEEHPVDRVAIVTTDHHTGRARRVFKQELRGKDVEVLMSAAPDERGYTPEDWWRSEEGRRIYFDELIKQVGSIVLYWLGRT